MSDTDPNERRDFSEPEAAEQKHLQELQKARQARVVKAVVALAIVIILIVFVIQNSDPVPVDFVFFSRSPRLIWVLVVTAFLGGVVGYLLGRPGRGDRSGGRGRRGGRKGDTRE